MVGWGGKYYILKKGDEPRSWSSLQSGKMEFCGEPMIINNPWNCGEEKKNAIYFI